MPSPCQAAETTAVTDPTGRRHPAVVLLALAAPVIATNISRTVMSFADFVMVSRLGTEAQAAIMPAGILLFCAIGFGMGLMSVVNTYVSQSLGRGRHAECSAYAWQGVILSIGLGVVTLPAIALVDPFFRLADHGDAVAAMEVTYVRIGIFGIGPTVAAVALSNFFIGVHRPAVGFFAALVSNVFNVAGNYALIFGHWGLPPMGIAGAAWATLAASILNVLILLIWMLRPWYARTFHTRKTWRPSSRRIGRILRIGFAPGVTFFFDIVSWAVFTIFLVGRFGTVQLAANNICFKILEISFMPAVGMGMALTASVGKSIGMQRTDLARRYVRWGVAFAVGYMGLMGLVMALLRHELPGLLIADGEPLRAEVIRWAAPMMLFCAVFQIFDALSISYNGALRGAGDTTWTAVAWIASATLLMIGGGLLVSHLMPHWASTGLWGAATAHVAAIGIAFALRYRYGPWERIDVFGGNSNQGEPRA